MSENSLTGISGHARDLLAYLGDYHRDAQTMPLSLGECRRLFFWLNTIKDTARTLRAAEADEFAIRERNPVVNSIALQAWNLCTGKIDVVEFAQRLEAASRIYAANPQWEEFINNHKNVVPAEILISNEGYNRPESQDPRYWGDSRRAQACVEWLLENVQNYHAAQNRLRQERNEAYCDPEFGKVVYIGDESRALNEHVENIRRDIALLYRDAVRYQRIKDKNYAVDSIIRYVFKAKSDDINVTDMIVELKNAAAEYTRHGEAYFKLPKMEPTFPRMPSAGVYLRINYPYSVVARKRSEHCEAMKKVYRDMIAENSDLDGGSANLTGFFLRVEDEKKAREIAVADPYCQNFFIFKATYLKQKLVIEIFRELEEQQKEEFVGTVTPFSQLEPGSALYRDFVNCGGAVTHVVLPRYAYQEIFFGPRDISMVHDASGKVLWPVSPEELQRETAAVAAARAALQQPATPGIG
jgi:hypothetical protein